MAEQRAGGRAGEFDLIARYFAPLARGFEGAFDLGDDTARFAPPPGTDLVVTTDTVVAGVHFLADDPPALVARKALRVNLSDLAAAGATPLAYQLSTAWASGLGEDWIAAFAAGLAEEQRLAGIHLSGGDTVGIPGPTTVTITAFGTVPAGRGLGRRGAHPGDLVMVSGTIGDGLLGLLALQGRLDALPRKERDFLIGRYRLPGARLQLGRLLPGLATACIDVSDGLAADLRHICDRSACAATISIDRIPLSSAAIAAIRIDPKLADRLLVGGDDYELLFSLPPQRAERAAVELAAAGVAISEIGRFEPGTGVELLRADGTVASLPAAGWQHF